MIYKKMRIILNFVEDVDMKYVTGKKEKIIDFLSKKSGSTYTPEEICDAILPDGKGKSTVYRIISSLVEDGCLRRVSDGKTRHVTYQYVGSSECHKHLHLKCKGCGKLIHMDDEISVEFEKRVMGVGFAIESGTLLYGQCAECLETGGL